VRPKGDTHATLARVGVEATAVVQGRANPANPLLDPRLGLWSPPLQRGPRCRFFLPFPEGAQAGMASTRDTRHRSLIVRCAHPQAL
jgi:hypothetical protein